jgi:hypothetical protein
MFSCGQVKYIFALMSYSVSYCICACGFNHLADFALVAGGLVVAVLAVEHHALAVDLVTLVIHHLHH